MSPTRPRLRLAATGGQATGPDRERPRIRVVLADDHAKIRRSIRLLLDAEDGVEVVAEAGDVSTVAEHARAHHPDVMILDLHDPDSSSIALVRRLRSEFPETALLILTMQSSAAFARQMLAAGSIGYVLKEHADADLAIAVRRAAAGERFVSARVAAGLEAFGSAIGQDGLTERELEVVRLTALGHTAAEIGHKLRVSPRTVESHRARVHEKLKLRSRAELVQYALGRGLLQTQVAEGNIGIGRETRMERAPVGT